MSGFKHLQRVKLRGYKPAALTDGCPNQLGEIAWMISLPLAETRSYLLSDSSSPGLFARSQVVSGTRNHLDLLLSG